ncbi:SDR family NAD(P)-dependent oxidoreductase [Acuticoccus sp. MNP-M23]|uniref:SDR family NAD(P)-dependent oxidoreductase n=1 Tax=Acuticoccus sp. MNP-M23 TaxID=3072793 RepID=UPI002814AD45|nr:SDR family NAD(P)-dependent oxidoreductase [Acuticoccus sp. MNP-M23]WMS41422.1 SDR family NAD(P)-dependent oxidoreductase [Acuticoccus sp. MNP-M23]
MRQNSSHPSLNGRNVLITGGGSGIGAAHVEAFCAQGANVTFFDIDTAASAALVERLESAGGTVPVFQNVDLTDIAALRDAIDTASARHGTIDVLVNNAANDTRHKFSEIEDAYFDDRVAVNLKHLVFAAQAVAPGMAAKGGGVIINTGSITWHAGFGGLPLYAMAKAGIEGLTRALARDLGPDNIRVNCIIPGWVMTERQLAHWVDDAARARIKEMQCLPGYVLPEDCAHMATWLASDDSRMISSQIFVVDGGWI